MTNREEAETGVVIPGSHGCLATAKYDVHFTGKSAHAGGSPEKGKNVLLAAAASITNLYAIPRHSKGVSRVNVGVLRGGSGRNVIPDEAFMEDRGAWRDDGNQRLHEGIRPQYLEGAARMHGVACGIKEMGSANSLVSDDFMMQLVKKVCEQHLHLPVSAT